MAVFSAGFIQRLMAGCALSLLLLTGAVVRAENSSQPAAARTLSGVVQHQDLRRVPQAIVHVRDQEGALIEEGVTDEAGEFTLTVLSEGTYSVSAVQETYRSEYVIVKVGAEPLAPLTLTLALTQEIALEVIAPLPPIQYKASSETYSLSRKDIEILPRGNNVETYEALLTVPGVIYGALKQTHVRQDHANQQYRLDGVPLPDSVSSTFGEIMSPRAWERADIILGGMEAQYGNRTALVLDITTKSGTKPGFGSLQIFGGSNETVTPSFEYGGTVGEKFRYYLLDSYTTTNRGLDPPTLGQPSFHNQSERNQTMLRSDYQVDNRNSLSWLVLNTIGKFQIPTKPGLSTNATVLGLLQAQDPSFTAVPSQDVNENQKENGQYTHLVWRHDVNTSQYFGLAGYFRRGYASFTTDPANVLAYTPDVTESFSASDQTRNAYAGGIRLDYTWVPGVQHLVKAGFQVDRTEAQNSTTLYDFARDPATGNPVGPVLTQDASNTNVQWREEVWIQDQWGLTDNWTINLGLRYDQIQGFYDEGQLGPRIGMTYKLNRWNVFHAYYGRLFTPPAVEQVAFTSLNTQGTTAEPDDPTGFRPRSERAHYFEVGTYHALGDWGTLELAAYYKRSHYLSDAGQFGTTPLLNFFAFQWGTQMGIDGALKVKLTDKLSGRGSVAWGRCKGSGLQSGNYLLDQKEIDDINSPGGVFCDHSQTMTSSAVLSYAINDRTQLSGQMLYGSGLRTAADNTAKTNSSHMPSYTVYNASITHVIPLPWHKQKLLLGFDIINLFNRQYFYNSGEGSLGLGVAHAGMPRSFFGRAQWLF